MPIPIDHLPIGEGIHPDGEPGASFFISRTGIELLERDGPEWKFEDARFIPEAILHTDAIFQGLLRPGQDEGLCYSVRPSRDPEIEDVEQPLPRFGFAFVVFVQICMGGYLVFDWEWREEDPDAPGHPLDWANDFERRTWHKI